MSDARPHLPDVTLCAVTSVNVEATRLALRRSMERVDFGECLLLTDAPTAADDDGIRQIAIAPLRSTLDYSRFVLNDLHRHVATSHVLLVQWDSFVLDTQAWDPAFLTYDYIGAPWPQFDDGHDVGNGGFSLRSRKLLDACLDPGFIDDASPEDILICRRNRAMLERDHAVRFAPREIAARFSFERASAGDEPAPTATFGFHGVFNMVDALGPAAFADTYRSLDHKGTVKTDLAPILRQLAVSPAGRRLIPRLLLDQLRRTRVRP